MVGAAREARDILVVEDDPLIVAFLRTALTRAGHHVHSAATGPAALELVRAGDHDLVLLDLGLPGMDGLAVLRELREGGSTVPVVVVTSRSDPADRAVATALGVVDYLVKPVALATLVGVVRSAVDPAVEDTSANPVR